MRYLFIVLISSFVCLAYAQTEVKPNAHTPKKEVSTEATHHHHHENDTSATKKRSHSSSGVPRVSKVYKGKRERTVARGYRVQIYSSSGGTKAKNTAQEMAAKVRKQFPELSIYCRFKSPRWVCRVGDFATREAAQRYLEKIHKAKISNETSIVIDDVLLAK